MWVLASCAWGAGAKAATISFQEHVNAASMQRLRQSMQRAIDNGARGITLLLESDGGDLQEALQMAQFLRALRGQAHLTTLTREGCGSSCTVLFAQGATRIASPRAEFYFHRVGVAGNLPPAQLEEIRAHFARRWVTEIRAVDHALASELEISGVLLGLSPPRTYRGGFLRKNGYSFVTEPVLMFADVAREATIGL
jgi:ATP-dependent protease ClpP protease subunit